MSLAQAILTRGEVTSFVCSTQSIHLAIVFLVRRRVGSSGQFILQVEPEGLSRILFPWMERARNAIVTLGRAERSPRPGPTRRMRSWVSRTEVRVRPPRLKPMTGKQQRPRVKSQRMQPTDKEAAKRRLSELHRLLNNCKGSMNARNRQKAEANDKAYDLNQKSVLALDDLAKEHVGPTPLFCQGVLRFGPVRAVLAKGRVRLWERRLSILCLHDCWERRSQFFKSKTPIFTQGLTRNGQHFEGFFYWNLFDHICLQTSWFNYV